MSETLAAREPADAADETDPGLRVRADAQARGLEIEFRVRPQARSLHHAAELMGIAASDIVKTLVVERSTAAGADHEYLFALVPGGRMISWPKLRARVGVNRLRMPDPAIAFAATGFERGAITPIGSTTAWPVYADETIAGKRIVMGSGVAGMQLFVDADALIDAYSAIVADISNLEPA